MIEQIKCDCTCLCILQAVMNVYEECYELTSDPDIKYKVDKLRVIMEIKFGVNEDGTAIK